MIQEAYCSYEVSKLLKEKGFDIPVRFEHHCVYNLDQKPQFHRLPHNFNGNEYSGLASQWYSAPTHQMAMAWLREVHNQHIVVKAQNNVALLRTEYYVEIQNLNEPTTKAFCVNGCTVERTYEEAVEAALKYSLENLI